ncbi:helix-turn-helix domain-containing protein [Candidatus Enterococcus ikei]|uniref:Helix-turn-helix domain-containing protein n=1 Tax=Candidatus Enterococcus ikei TaxID=2815326 RepID=A0ABS3H2C5_9ENTE|nr:helix-turn-helix domain-containing protein [Enterococcus sp. DIV0869a]MBO0440814.1 helix-turn-helix domain-containing protein [Enterococcus sp. DIV0869a]
MKIEELLDKKEAREIGILRKVILAGGRIADTELLDYLGVSKASFESDLKELGYYLKPYEKDCSLFYDGQWVAIHMSDQFSVSKVLDDYVRASIKFQLIDHLFHYREFTIAQLTTKFMISESSLFRKIKELNQLLQEFELKIRNGQLKGEELQIRYFYFQIYWFLTPYEIHQEKTLTVQNSRIIEALEKALSLSFEEYSKLKISLWLTISKKRILVQSKVFKELYSKSKSYEQDPFFKTLRAFVIRFFSRYPLEIDEEESLLHFIFLTSMSVLAQSDFAAYSLIRGRRTPTSLADTFVLEHVILYYRPQKFFPELEKKIFYYFSQIHSRLYFFKGELELFDRENIWQKEQHLSSHQLADFSHVLLDKSLECFDTKYEQGNSLHEWSLVKYLSVLATIDFEIVGETRIGIDLKMDHLYKEVMTQVLVLSLKNLNGLTIEPYDSKRTYDLMITNVMKPNNYRSVKEVYVLSELGSTYDINQIRMKIRELHGKR